MNEWIVLSITWAQIQAYNTPLFIQQTQSSHLISVILLNAKNDLTHFYTNISDDINIALNVCVCIGHLYDIWLLENVPIRFVPI